MVRKLSTGGDELIASGCESLPKKFDGASSGKKDIPRPIDPAGSLKKNAKSESMETGGTKGGDFLPMRFAGLTEKKSKVLETARRLTSSRNESTAR